MSTSSPVQVLPAEALQADSEMPVAIVGAGACGLTAALALQRAGIDAVVLERDAFAAGSTALSSGFIPAPGTQAQRALGIDDSPAQFEADIQAKAHGEAAPQLAQRRQVLVLRVRHRHHRRGAAATACGRTRRPARPHDVGADRYRSGPLRAGRSRRRASSPARGLACAASGSTTAPSWCRIMRTTRHSSRSSSRSRSLTRWRG